MAVALLNHDNQRHLKTMQFVVHFLDNSEAYFSAEVYIHYICSRVVTVTVNHSKRAGPVTKTAVWLTVQ